MHRRGSGISLTEKGPLAARRLRPAAFALLVILSAPSTVRSAVDMKSLLAEMDAAWARVDSYQTRVEVKNSGADGSVEIERFLYSFKKPRRIRIDMETPHPGMVIIYPDENGKAVVRLSGVARLLPLHLSPESRLLLSSTGQRIDQTDLGLLIANIRHSLTDKRRGPVNAFEEQDLVSIRVMADDHFRPNVVTSYEFLIDRKYRLPVGVTELTTDGRMERTVRFHDLTINRTLPAGFFDGEDALKDDVYEQTR